MSMNLKKELKKLSFVTEGESALVTFSKQHRKPDFLMSVSEEEEPEQTDTVRVEVKAIDGETAHLSSNDMKRMNQHIHIADNLVSYKENSGKADRSLWTLENIFDYQVEDGNK